MRLKVSDAAGLSVETSLALAVRLPDPRPEVIAGGFPWSMDHPIRLLAGSDVQMAGRAYADSLWRWPSFAAIPAQTRYRWDFGDGATAEGARVRHRYEAPGSFTVSLRVTDVQGREFLAPPYAVTVLAPRVELLASRLGGRGAKDGAADLALFKAPAALAAGPDGSTWVVDGGSTLRRIAPDGTVSTVAGNAVLSRQSDNWLPGSGSAASLGAAQAIAADGAGAAYVSNGAGILKIGGDGVVGIAVRVPNVGRAAYIPALAVAPAGDALYFASGRKLLFRAGDGSEPVLLAGSESGDTAVDGEAALARFSSIVGLAMGSGGGEVWINDECHGVRRLVLSTGKVETVVRFAGSLPGGCSGGGGLALAPGGGFYVGTRTGVQWLGVNGETRPVSVAGWVSAMTVDSRGRLLTTTPGEHTVRRQELNGTEKTIGVSALDPDRAWPPSLALAALTPRGVDSFVIHPNGKAYFIDQHRLLSFDPSDGRLALVFGDKNDGRTVDGGFSTARIGSMALSRERNIAVDAAGRIVFAEWRRIRRVDLSSGQVSTQAGADGLEDKDGIGTAAGLVTPLGLTPDSAGNIYAICDGRRVVRLSPAGEVVTLHRATAQVAHLIVSSDDQLYLWKEGLFRLAPDLSLVPLIGRVPDGSPSLFPTAMAFGPDGAIWALIASDVLSQAVLWRVSLSGDKQEFALVPGFSREILNGYPDWEFNPVLSGMAFDGSGRLLLSGSDGFSFWRLAGPLSNL